MKVFLLCFMGIVGAGLLGLALLWWPRRSTREQKRFAMDPVRRLRR